MSELHPFKFVICCLIRVISCLIRVTTAPSDPSPATHPPYVPAPPSRVACQSSPPLSESYPSISESFLVEATHHPHAFSSRQYSESYQSHVPHQPTLTHQCLVSPASGACGGCDGQPAQVRNQTSPTPAQLPLLTRTPTETLSESRSESRSE